MRESLRDRGTDNGCMFLRNASDQLPVYMVTSNKIKVKVKDKIHPRTGYEGPEGQ